MRVSAATVYPCDLNASRSLRNPGLPHEEEVKDGRAGEVDHLLRSLDLISNMGLVMKK